MEKLRFILFSIVTLSLLGLFGYWSITTIQSGTEHKTSQKIEQLEEENGNLKTEVVRLTEALRVLELKVEKPAPVVAKEPEPTTVYKHQLLIDELQKLVNAKVFLKLKSKGAAVGTVQKFLNIYNNSSRKVDNDYGESTKNAVAAFQKAVGITADGEAGPGTFGKMIDWLKEQK